MWFPRGEQEEKEGRLREVQDSFWLARRRKKFNRIASSHTPRITIIFSPSLFSLFLPPALSIYGRNGDNTTSIQPSQPPCFSLSVLVEFLGVGLWGTELKGEGCRGVDIYFLLLFLLFSLRYPAVLRERGVVDDALLRFLRHLFFSAEDGRAGRSCLLTITLLTGHLRAAYVHTHPHTYTHGRGLDLNFDLGIVTTSYPIPLFTAAHALLHFFIFFNIFYFVRIRGLSLSAV